MKKLLLLSFALCAVVAGQIQAESNLVKNAVNYATSGTYDFLTLQSTKKDIKNTQLKMDRLYDCFGSSDERRRIRKEWELGSGTIFSWGKFHHIAGDVCGWTHRLGYLSDSRDNEVLKASGFGLASLVFYTLGETAIQSWVPTPCWYAAALASSALGIRSTVQSFMYNESIKHNDPFLKRALDDVIKEIDVTEKKIAKTSIAKEYLTHRLIDEKQIKRYLTLAHEQKIYERGEPITITIERPTQKIC